MWPGSQQIQLRPITAPNFMIPSAGLQDSFTALEQCRVPVIAAIQGGCIGGGVDMITACDIRLGTEDSFICIQEINVGMTADVGTFPRILNYLPEGIVRELAYTGRKMSAADLHARGFYNHVYAQQSDMVEAALDMAREIASKPPLLYMAASGLFPIAGIILPPMHWTRSALEYVYAGTCRNDGGHAIRPRRQARKLC